MHKDLSPTKDGLLVFHVSSHRASSSSAAAMVTAESGVHQHRQTCERSSGREEIQEKWVEKEKDLGRRNALFSLRFDFCEILLEQPSCSAWHGMGWQAGSPPF